MKSVCNNQTIYLQPMLKSLFSSLEDRQLITNSVSIKILQYFRKEGNTNNLGNISYGFQIMTDQRTAFALKQNCIHNDKMKPMNQLFVLKFLILYRKHFSTLFTSIYDCFNIIAECNTFIVCLNIIQVIE